MTRSIKRILIANRGEIAVRIIRACREIGIETVQVYSDADRQSLPVKLANKTVCIGRAQARDSYLNAEFLISAALTQRADAIHPGYGFLSENASFAKLCEDEGIVFIGPRADVIRLMGDKAVARKRAAEAGVPTIPGSRDKVGTIEEASAAAETVGYPVLLKASAGGGGRGMRVVHAQEALANAFLAASKEAKLAFGDDAIYIERYLKDVRHVEIQVLADNVTALHLGERDCSVQRRNQKLVEESPSPALTSELRERMEEAAIRLCRHVGYTSAGTIEFILDAKTNSFYFMEMNTRIQVEHPVTEMVTGMDLLKAQIQIAAGIPLNVQQQEIRFTGHALECRINAEDSENNFIPCPGRITHFSVPGGPGIRVDSHIFPGYEVPPYYDSLLAKIIAWGNNRREAIARMRRALCEMNISGIKTTVPFYLQLLNNEQFLDGKIHTRFVEEVLLKP